MLLWRKIYSAIIGSDKLSRVSDSAFRLYVYLLVAQDDAGNYPWTRVSRKALTVGTSWTDKQANTFAQELVSAGLLHVTEGQLHATDVLLQVVNGPKYNGRDKSQRRVIFLYESDLNSNVVQPNVSDMQPTQGAREEERGGEKKREEKKGRANKREREDGILNPPDWLVQLRRSDQYDLPDMQEGYLVEATFRPARSFRWPKSFPRCGPTRNISSSNALMRHGYAKG